MVKSWKNPVFASALICGLLVYSKILPIKEKNPFSSPVPKEKVTEIALGYPLNMDGSEGEKALSSKRFKNSLLEVNPNLKISLVDERMTTIIATKRLLEADLSRNKRHKVIDKQAAVVILESYLQRKEFENNA